MPAKNRITRRLDLPAPVMHGAVTGGAGGSVDNPAPPPPPNPPDGPTDVVLTTGITYSTASPLAYIAATWLPPNGSSPTRYVFQVSEGSGFPAASTTTFSSNVPYATATGLKPATPYYGRVAGVVSGVQGVWTNGTPYPITTASDTVPAGVPTFISAVWIGTGDLRIRWTNPTEANFKDVQIRIFASSGGTEYGVARYSARGEFIYTWSSNYNDTGGALDNALYVEIRSRTFSNVLGTVVNTGLITKAAPGIPTSITHTWSGDTAGNGTAGATWTISWLLASDAARNRVVIDTIPRASYGDNYTYDLSLNKSEHTGTADPALAYSLYAIDAFGTASTAASGSARNYEPPAPTVTLTQGAVSGLYATVTSAPTSDFWRYEYVFKRDGGTVATVYSASSTNRYEQQGAGDDGFHSWTVTVRQEDLFGQFSAATTPAAVAFEGLTLPGLRSQAIYSDSEGTSSAVLKAALADGNTTSGGLSYAP